MTCRAGLLLLCLAACEPSPSALPPMMPPQPYGTPWMAPPAAPHAAPRQLTAAPPMPAAKPRPRVSWHLRVPVAAKHAPDARLTLELRDAGGRSLWRCERVAPLAEGAFTDVCPMRELLAAGSYVLATAFRAGQKDAAVSQPFSVTLEEVALEIVVSLTTAGSLEELLVRRVLPAHPEVQLKREWTNPNASVPLRYVLANGSATHTLHVSGIQGIVMTSLDRADQGAYVPHTRGTVCQAPHGIVTVPPGGSVAAEEGHFVGPLRPLDEGAYRIRLRYALAPDTRPAGAPRALLQQVYEVHDELRVTSDALAPVEDIRDPFSCDPPFTVDAEGVRHIKPECLGY